jgi:branched-chain amino acid transport system substrate-binding protein
MGQQNSSEAETDRSSSRQTAADGSAARRRSRRAFLATSATVSLASVVGCLGGEGSTPTESGDGGGTPTDASDGGSTPTDAGDGSTDTPGEDGSTPTDAADGEATTTTVDYPDEVVIGSIHPLTGSTSYVGQRLHNAVELAGVFANENGGIQSMNGAEVTVLQGDHENDPSTGAEVAGELIGEGADILTGTYSSPVASSIAQVAETEQVPFVIDIGVAAAILQERDLNYVYRAQPNSWSQGADHVEGFTAVADQGDIDIDTAGLFYVDTTYGQAIKDGLVRAFDEAGIEVVAEATIGFGGTADTQVTRLRQAEPDVLVPTVFENQMLELVSSMTDQDYWPTVFAACASAGMNSEGFEQMGEIVNGALTSGYALNPNLDRAETVDERFMETYDTPSMTANVGMAYSTGELLVELFEQAGSADPGVLNDTLQDIEVEDHVMAMPPITFDEDGENANPRSVMSQVQEMEAHIVYPDKYAQSDIVTTEMGG